MKSLQTARKVIIGVEVMYIPQTSQGVKSIPRQMQLISRLFGLSA
ncbi:hypothetical protein [Bacillus thuringiensis]|nr:hypothetical protein [Bacillus thuringiensis]